MDVNPLELAATLVTLACVILGVKRSLWQFPVGIVGTAIFFVVVWQAQLWANAALQVFFVFVQLYGWWYWLRGFNGKRPPIRTANRVWVAISVAIAAFSASVLGAAAPPMVTPPPPQAASDRQATPANRTERIMGTLVASSGASSGDRAHACDDAVAQ